jgi:hypothetical protein
MKKIIFIIVLGIMCTFSYAQTAQNTMIDFNKTKVPGIVVAIPTFDVATINAALQARLETTGKLKGSNFKGFRLYGGQTFADFGNARYDIYTKVVPGSKKDKKVLVQLMVSMGNENFISQTSDHELNQRMIDFLTNFATSYLPEFDRNRKIQENSKNLEKLEKEYGKLVSDRDKLKSNLEKQEKAITVKAEEIAKIKANLNNLKP